MQVEREALALKLTRVTEAIEAGGELETLLDRMAALESQRAALDQEAENIRGTLGEARTTLASAKETVQRHAEVFALWRAGKLSDEESRTRLSSTLRELVTKIELRKDRKLGVTLALAEEDDFVCEADLRAVYDAEGELVAKI